MSADFKKVSDGRVDLKIYAGGTQGNEGEMIRKMAIGQLQAAAITAVGLHEITPEPQAEDVPTLVDSYEEYDYVHQHLQPQLDAALAKKGYVALQWGEVGFVYLFASQPWDTPAGFAKGKVFTWNGDPGAEQAWKAAGFQPVVLSSTDLIPALQSGMINVVAEPALYAYTANVYAKADNMLDLKWGFLSGATVVKKEIWDRIPADLRPKLLQIAASYGEKVREIVRKQNEEAVEQMKQRGLKVVQPKDLAAWRQSAQRAMTVIRGKVVPAETFDEVKRLAAEYRSQHAKK